LKYGVGGNDRQWLLCARRKELGGKTDSFLRKNDHREGGKTGRTELGETKSSDRNSLNSFLDLFAEVQGRRSSAYRWD